MMQECEADAQRKIRRVEILLNFSGGGFLVQSGFMPRLPLLPLARYDCDAVHVLQSTRI